MEIWFPETGLVSFWEFLFVAICGRWSIGGGVTVPFWELMIWFGRGCLDMGSCEIDAGALGSITSWHCPNLVRELITEVHPLVS